MTTPTMTWTRLARRLGSDHNPLRRRSDLLAAWLVPAMVAAFLVFGAPAVAAAAWWVHAGDTAARHAARSWHRVPGVLLQSAPGPMMSDGGANSWITWSMARWSAGGRQHVSKVPALAGSRADAAVTVWLDRAGHVRMPPVTASQARDRVTTAAAAALSALAVALACLALLGRWVLDRRRLTDWETAWMSVGPQWRGLG